LRRPAIAPPQAAISAVEGLKILAGFGRPGPNATLGAADFDDIRDLGDGRDPPLEPVAAQIGEAAAAIDVFLCNALSVFGVWYSGCDPVTTAW
jgi:hypothetical protein